MSDNKPKFLNPYEAFDDDASCQIQTYVSPEDKDLLRSARCGAPGTFSTTAALLIRQLCIELRQRDITDNSKRSEYESFLTAMRIVPADEYESYVVAAAQSAQRDVANHRLQDSSAGRTNRKTPRSNDKRRTASKGGGVEKRPDEPSNLPGEAGTDSNSGRQDEGGTKVS